MDTTTHQTAWRTTVGYYLAFIILGLIVAATGPILPALAQNTATTLGTIGIIFTAGSFGNLLAAGLGSHLYDRLPGHKLMAAMLLIMAFMVALLPFQTQLGLLIAIKFVLGMAIALYDVGGNTLIVWVHGQKVAPYMNALHFFFGVGAFLSPIVIAQMIKLTNLQGALWLLALLALPIVLLLLRLPSPPHIKPPTKQSTPASNPLLIGLIMAFFFLYVGAEVGFGGWIFTYAQTLDLPDDTAAYLNAAFWGTFTAGRLLAIPITARFKPHVVLTVDLLICLTGLATILLLPSSVPALWVGAMAVGVGMASVFPTMLTFAERRLTITGRMTGLFFVGGGIGATTLPWLMGQLFEHVNPQAIMWASATSLAGALIVVGLLLQAGRNATP